MIQKHCGIQMTCTKEMDSNLKKERSQNCRFHTYMGVKLEISIVKS